MRIFLEAPTREIFDFNSAYQYWAALKKRKLTSL